MSLFFKITINYTPDMINLIEKTSRNACNLTLLFEWCTDENNMFKKMLRVT